MSEEVFELCLQFMAVVWFSPVQSTTHPKHQSINDDFSRIWFITDNYKSINSKPQNIECIQSNPIIHCICVAQVRWFASSILARLLNAFIWYIQFILPSWIQRLVSPVFMRFIHRLGGIMFLIQKKPRVFRNSGNASTILLLFIRFVL